MRSRPSVGPAGQSAEGRALLYIDMAYCLAELRQRGHLQFFQQRHSGGYFDKVVGLHPLADRVTSLDSAVERHAFSDRQDVIEAKSAALGLPRCLFPLDLALTQRRLLDHVADVVRKEGASLIAATDPLYSGLFGLWLRRRTGVPLVIYLVGNYDLDYETTGSLAMPKMFPSRALEKAVIRYVLRRADLVAAGSETLRDYAISHGATAGRTDVFRVYKHMAPAHRVPPSERPPLTAAELDDLGIGNAEKLFITVARLEPVKMVDHAIRAFAMVRAKHPDALLLLAGDGSERHNLEALARDLGIADGVRFLGLVEQHLLARIAPRCIALSPLTGIALFETSMAGCPAIAYDCDSAVREMVETGRTGTLLEPLDWKGMGRAAIAVLEDPELRSRQGEAIRHRAEQITDEQALYAHEHAAFDRLLRS